MIKWKDSWTEMLPYEKKFDVASWILLALFLIAFLFEILDKFGVYPVAIDMFIVSKGILVAMNSCQAVVCWRKNRNVAYASMMLAISFGLGTVWEIVKLFI